MKPTHIIALLIIAVTLGVTLFTFAKSVAPSISVSEAIERPGELVQVRGTILKDSVNWNPAATELTFNVREVKKIGKGEVAGDRIMRVVYNKVKPDSFDEANGVEVIGRYSNGVFRAENMLVKCPSKYIEEGSKETADARGDK